MKAIETVTALVNCLFSAYDKPIHGLDWEEKINEYADVINDYISFDTNLNELYKDIRGNFASLPQPSAIRKMLSKTRNREVIRQQVEHPDNGKMIVIACYKEGEVAEIRDYVVHNTENTKHISEVSKDLRERFDAIKMYEFSKGCTLMGDTVFIPNGYNEKGHVIEYKQQRIA